LLEKESKAGVDAVQIFLTLGEECSPSGLSNSHGNTLTNY
jgi:hypothetical protein